MNSHNPFTQISSHFQVILPFILLLTMNVFATKKEINSIELKEIYRITDKKGEIYFKDPRNIKISEDGSLYVADEEQMLHFDRNGKYLRNVITMGQGPGEISGGYEYYIHKNSLYFYSSGNRRFFKKDINGEYIEDVGPSKRKFYWFLGMHRNNLVVIEQVWPIERKNNQFDVILRKVIIINTYTEEEKEIYEYKQKIYVADRTSKHYGESIERLSNDGEYIIGFHGYDYSIEIFDINRQKKIENISRPYVHVRHIEGEREKEYRKKYNGPKVEYESDIQDIIIDYYHDQVLVKTSKYREELGCLYDVIENNKYKESFYISGEKEILAINGNILYVREKDEDENYQIVLYQRK